MNYVVVGYLAKICAISGIRACTKAKVWCFAPLHLATLLINRTSSGIFGNVWKLSEHLWHGSVVIGFIQKSRYFMNMEITLT